MIIKFEISSYFISSLYEILVWFNKGKHNIELLALHLSNTRADNSKVQIQLLYWIDIVIYALFCMPYYIYLFPIISRILWYHGISVYVK